LVEAAARVGQQHLNKVRVERRHNQIGFAIAIEVGCKQPTTCL